MKRNEEKVSKKEITEHRDTALSCPVENREGKGKIDTLVEQVRALEAQMETKVNDSAQAREDMREAELALQRAEGELQTLRGLADSSEKAVQALQVNGNHRLAAFGAQMPKIVEEIRKCKEFTKAPIGPLGAHINMVDGADEQLARAVEGVLGERYVSSFLCDNSDDRLTLHNLFQKMQLSRIPLIYTGKFTDVKCNHFHMIKVQHDRYKTLMDCVDIADANVFNCVICPLNRVLFIPTEAEAQRLLSTVTTVPKNLSYAKVPNYIYYPAPNYHRCIFPEDQTRGVLMESSKVTIAKREEQLVSAKAAVARVEPKVAEANAQRRKLEKKIREQVNQVKGVQDQLRLVKGQICELKNKEARDRDIAVLEDYLCDDCRYCK